MGEEQPDNGPGRDLMSGMAPWMRFVVLVGAPAAIAMWLTYFVSARIGADIDHISQRLDAHASVSSAAAANLSGFILDSQEETRTLILLMRQLCLNTATDAQQRRECIQR